MSKKIFETDAECSSCNGTGLYCGMGERDGMAVQCRTCAGTGKMKIHVEYKDFTGRKRREDIKRVLHTNPGISTGCGNGHTLKDFGGITYSEWLDGKPFDLGTEMREYTCPCWWYQSADWSKKPEWKECGYGAFSDCKRFKSKEKCWERFDKENQKKK